MNIDRTSEPAAVVGWCQANAARLGFRGKDGPEGDLVGAWVWIYFDAKPTDEVRAELKAAGFQWSPKRAAWNHRCGDRRVLPRHLRGKVNPYDVHEYAGIADLEVTGGVS